MSNPAYSEVLEDLLDRKELPSAAKEEEEFIDREDYKKQNPNLKIDV